MQRMGRISRGWWVAAVLVAGLGLAAPAFAEIAVGQPQTPIRKLSRGLANALGGWLEIPLTISTVSKEEGPVAAASWGVMLGLGAAINRTVVGVAEVATFPFPLPQVGYGPVISPEFLLNPDDMAGMPPAR